MRNRIVGITAFLFVVWIGYHLVEGVREQSRVKRLPKKVAVLGPYSANGGIAEAKRVASYWDSHCQLQSISVVFGGDPHANDPGMAEDGIPIAPSGWNYRFFSQSRGWFLDLRLWPDGRCEPSSFNGLNYLDTQPLPREFLDSTAAVSIAEKLYGREYREKGKVFRLPIKLTTWRSSVDGPRDPVAHRATWQIEYLSMRNRDRVDLYLILDAVTGDELCAVEYANTKIKVLTNNYQH